MMLNCKQISELSSKALDTSLPLFTHIGVKLHLSICNNCKKYAKQLQFINNISKNLDSFYKEHSLTKEAKDRISKAVKNKLTIKK